MKATAIIRNVTDEFWSGFGSSVVGFDNLSARQQFDLCCGATGRDMGISVKLGDGSFRDRVELNSLVNGGCSVSSTKSPRRGYTLVTFDITSAHSAK